MRILKTIGKTLILGIVVAVTFVMNIIGAIICAVTEQ